MLIRSVWTVVLGALTASAFATPESVQHLAAAPVFGEAASVTMREPEVPREDEAVDVWAVIGYSFFYTDVAIYYTTDGSTPGGSFGVGTGSTQVLRSSLGQVTFVRNQGTPGGTLDWWRATLPAGARAYGQTVRYRISSWHSAGGPEVFANNTGCADGTCDDPGAPAAEFSFTNKLAWPGAGAGNPSPSTGYPPVSFWKEEAVIGNTYCAAMLDQNGTYYDFHFPTPGGVQGVGTRNEGYVDGGDTFPALLPAGWRGQMHLNQAMAGIRVDGTTYWLSNQSGVGYSQVTQAYVPGTNTVATSQVLTGANILVTQSDFAPIGVSYPLGAGGQPVRHMAVKRMTLRNQGPSARVVNVYFYMDPALNGGDGHDTMFVDAARGAMCAYDKTRRTVTGTGVGFTDPNEYNPTTFAGYDKNIALYLAASMKVLGTPGSGGGVPAADSWRDTSGDDGQGWIGTRIVLPPAQDIEVNIALVGGHFRPNPISDNIPALDGVYDGQVAPGLDWFLSGSAAAAESATFNYWNSWLNSGVTVSTPDAAINNVFNRGLLATALHVDGVNGGVIAGFHNGAYPFVWPRDAVYAAVGLARTGHLAEAAGVYTWMRDTCYRDNEPWGKGFWKQKYTTDGYVVWGAPQIDETAVFPWGVWYQFLVTGDLAFLSGHYPAVRDAAFTSSSSPSNPAYLPQLNYNPTRRLMYSNNVWEDSYDFFVYSNANVVRGLRDAASIASTLGNPIDAADFTARANTIKGGLDDRLDQDEENTDISQLGIVYPFDVYPPTDFKAARLVDRINGLRRRLNDNPGEPLTPLVNFAGFYNDGYGWTDLINRYWGDTYWGNGSPSSPWGAGPWFLSTLWYGLYYASRADYTVGDGDIDNHKYRVDLCVSKLGPVGLGAEQIAPRAIPGDPSRPGSLLYSGQNDFVLQTAWPNAWESMTTFVDAVMAFLDYTPAADADAIRLAPKLPTAWNTMTFNNLPMKNQRVNVTVSRTATTTQQAFTNVVGGTVNVSTWLRIPPGRWACSVTREGGPVAFTRDVVANRVLVNTTLTPGAGASTILLVQHVQSPDQNNDGAITPADVAAFVNVWFASLTGGGLGGDFDGNSVVNPADVAAFINQWVTVLSGGC